MDDDGDSDKVGCGGPLLLSPLDLDLSPPPPSFSSLTCPLPPLPPPLDLKDAAVAWVLASSRVVRSHVMQWVFMFQQMILDVARIFLVVAADVFATFL